jgi:DNA-directed RNA polymerase subunit RPC12/RpoP
MYAGGVNRKRLRRKKKLTVAQGILAERYRSTPIAQSTSISLLSRFKGEYYKCPHCKLLIPMDEAKISGFNAEHSVRYIRCPRCRGRITGIIRGSPLRDVLEGISSIAAGGTLAYLLFPLLSIYALQLGFFFSLYGTLKILIRPGR